MAPITDVERSEYVSAEEQYSSSLEYTSLSYEDYTMASMEI